MTAFQMCALAVSGDRPGLILVAGPKRPGHDHRRSGGREPGEDLPGEQALKVEDFFLFFRKKSVIVHAFSGNAWHE